MTQAPPLLRHAYPQVVIWGGASRAVPLYYRGMIPIDSRDLDPDLRAEYDATCRTMNEIWDVRRHLAQRRKENLRAPDTVETYKEDRRLDALEERLDERESVCKREQSAIKVKHLQRELEKIPQMRRRFPDDKYVEEYEQQLRSTIHELELGTSF